MTLIIIFSILFSITLIFVYRTFLHAPIKYEDEEKFKDALKYEERFAEIYENKHKSNLNGKNIRVILRKEEEDHILPPVNINKSLKLKL
jgi:hypothetical protein